MDQTETISNSHHGVKRRAQDHLESEQRLSKRLSLLNISRSSIFCGRTDLTGLQIRMEIFISPSNPLLRVIKLPQEVVRMSCR